MKMKFISIAMISGLVLLPLCGYAQYKQDSKTDGTPLSVTPKDTSAPVVITLDQALQIALSENTSVKVADKEIERTGYAKKGTYASLLPQVDLSGAFQRTIKKQVMYMDFDMSSLTGGSTGTGTGTGSSTSSSQSSKSGFAVGRWNTYSAGVAASMPLVNAQLWKSIEIAGKNVELSIEKARSSRLDMVTQVKQSFFGVLFAKEALNTYKEVYDNAANNFEQTKKKYNAQKASELEFTRAKSTVANAIPNVYNAESSVALALWQLKAVMGVDLDQNIDIAGSLSDYSEHMFYDIHQNDSISLDYNSTMRQLAIQADQLAQTVKMQKYAYLPTLAATFSYSMNAMNNDFKFSEYQWNPYSYAALSLSIPVFSGGKRYNNVRQAQVQYDELQLQTLNTERQLKIAIRQYLNTMETKMKSYASAQDAIETALKAYSIAQKSYEVGRSTITELNDAQLALTQARLAQSQAIYEFVVARANLEQTLGQDFIGQKGNTDLNGSYK